jgi:hypothetical protein
MAPDSKIEIGLPPVRPDRRWRHAVVGRDGQELRLNWSPRPMLTGLIS